MKAPDRRIQLLLFRLGQVRFGVPAEQVTGLRGFGQAAAAGAEACWIHGRLGFPQAPCYRAPTEAQVAHPDRPPAWVVLDAIEDLQDVALDAIKPFPALVQPHALRRGLWGILPGPGQPVLLVDLARVLETET